MKNTSVLLSACLLSGCAAGKYPDHQFLVCLTNAADINSFRARLSENPVSVGLDIRDQGAEVSRQLRATGSDSDHGSANTLHVVAIGPSGFSFTATNLGLADRNVAMGFSLGENRANGEALVTQVIQDIRAHWPVRVMPSDRGILPGDTCG